MRRIHPSDTVPVPDQHTRADPELTDDEVMAAYAPDPLDILRVNMVSTVDGASTLRGQSRGISTEADKRLFHVLRSWADVIFVGASTVAQERYVARPIDDDKAADRRARGLREQLTIAIWSPRLSLPADAPIFTDSAIKPILLTSPNADPPTLAALEGLAEIVPVRGDGPAPVIAALRERGFRSILSEGGPHALAGLLAADLVDELCLTVSPLTVGPGPGRIVAGAPVTVPPESRTPGQVAPVPADWDLAAAYVEESSLFLRYRRAHHQDGNTTTRET